MGGSGDPSPVIAYGVFARMKACANENGAAILYAEGKLQFKAPVICANIFIQKALKQAEAVYDIVKRRF